MNTCTIEIGEKEYTLCLTREAVKKIESIGFNISNFIAKPVTYMDVLWYGGFVANHSDVNPNLALKLMDSYKEEGGNINEVIDFLAEEYSNFVNAQDDINLKKNYKKKAKITRANETIAE